MRTPTSGSVIITIVAALAGATLFATTSVTVVDGDTLTAIAARHGVTTAELVAWNDIDDPDRIFVGDVIVLAPPATDGGSSTPVEHVVSAGDTLTLIAQRYGASVAGIAAQNQLADVDHIRVGQHLTIGDAPDTEPAHDETAAASAEHIVVAGDTLFSIARRFGHSVSTLAEANTIADTDQIRVGDVLVIPETIEPVEPSPSDDEPAPEPSETGDDEVEDAAPADPPVDDPATNGSTDDEVPVEDSGEASPATSSASEITEAFGLWSGFYDVDQDLLEAIAWNASGWDPSKTGLDDRVGIAQMTRQQIELVESRMIGREMDPFDGVDGVRLAARYLRYVHDRTHSDTEALMAFRQGLDSFLDDGPTADAEAFALATLAIRDQRS